MGTVGMFFLLTYWSLGDDESCFDVQETWHYLHTRHSLISVLGE